MPDKITPYTIKTVPSEWLLNKWKEYSRIIKSFDVRDVPEDDQQLILQALHSDLWDWFTDCDGCTCVSEPSWPTIYFPPCVAHDFRCFIGKNLYVAACEFRRLNKAYRMDKWRRNIRFAFVVAAIPYFKSFDYLFGTPQQRKKRKPKGFKKSILK
ncbi:MAG: hypothetical protein KAR42_14845 [candidate division Zixibacteria bacterium]|nr:hypothetical protein [candidate division Zixibacteria bacterium]